ADDPQSQLCGTGRDRAHPGAALDRLWSDRSHGELLARLDVLLVDSQLEFLFRLLVWAGIGRGPVLWPESACGIAGRLPSTRLRTIREEERRPPQRVSRKIAHARGGTGKGSAPVKSTPAGL